jgi:hypothetical protein
MTKEIFAIVPVTMRAALLVSIGFCRREIALLKSGAISFCAPVVRLEPTTAKRSALDPTRNIARNLAIRFAKRTGRFIGWSCWNSKVTSPPAVLLPSKTKRINSSQFLSLSSAKAAAVPDSAFSLQPSAFLLNG